MNNDKMIGYTVILAFTVGMVGCMVNDHPCCNGDNIFKGRMCMEGNTPHFDCTNGRYMLDPQINQFDNYSITNEGMLQNDDSPEVSKY